VAESAGLRVRVMGCDRTDGVDLPASDLRVPDSGVALDRQCLGERLGVGLQALGAVSNTAPLALKRLPSGAWQLQAPRRAGPHGEGVVLYHHHLGAGRVGAPLPEILALDDEAMPLRVWLNLPVSACAAQRAATDAPVMPVLWVEIDRHPS